jgi:hypothetical protein
MENTDGKKEDRKQDTVMTAPVSEVKSPVEEPKVQEVVDVPKSKEEWVIPVDGLQRVVYAGDAQVTLDVDGNWRILLEGSAQRVGAVSKWETFPEAMEAFATWSKTR